MIGLIFFGALGLWFVLCLKANEYLTKRFVKMKQKWVVSIPLFVFLFCLPVADELVSYPSFAKACAERTPLSFDPDRIRGRTVFLADEPSGRIRIGLLEAYMNPQKHLDATTNELLIESATLHLGGGLLVRSLGMSGLTDGAFAIPKYCDNPEKYLTKAFLKKYDLKKIERSKTK